MNKIIISLLLMASSVSIADSTLSNEFKILSEACQANDSSMLPKKAIPTQQEVQSQLLSLILEAGRNSQDGAVLSSTFISLNLLINRTVGNPDLEDQNIIALEARATVLRLMRDLRKTKESHDVETARSTQR